MELPPGVPMAQMSKGFCEGIGWYGEYGWYGWYLAMAAMVHFCATRIHPDCALTSSIQESERLAIQLESLDADTIFDLILSLVCLIRW